MTIQVPSDSDVADVPAELKQNVWLGRLDLFYEKLDQLYNWGRAYSLWPVTFGLACCAIEMIATGAARYDQDRFGAALYRASPRQSDLMIVSGTVTKKMVPQIVRIYNQMPDPKYVMSMGACANGGGPFKEGYNVVSGIDKFLPVDVYVPGCPPTPQALLHGLIKLQELIQGQSIFQVPWYKPETDIGAFPIPVLGPDIIAPDEVPRIKSEIEKMRELAEQEEGTPKKVKPPKLPKWDETPTDTAQALADDINEAFGEGVVTPEADALLVPADHLLKFGYYVRDSLAYDLLSNVTGVDYLGRTPRFEVVYHAYSTTETDKPVLVFKVRLPEDKPELPSLCEVWQTCYLQEREIYDLYGFSFTNHPNLKRILLWDEFEGHPMRRDYEEAYYEEPAKPFGSRWPEGYHKNAEAANPFGRNVVYPQEWDIDEYLAHIAERQAEQSLAHVIEARDLHDANEDFETDRITINIGPQHPSTHGVFRMVTTIEGETIIDLEPVLGYLHRNHEKIGERNGWLMNMPYTDRLDYLNSMQNNQAYAMVVEKLADIPVPERAEYIRVIMSELTRIFSHMTLLGFLMNDLGALATPLFYAFESRERVLDLLEEASGSRMMCNYLRFGGVVYDVSDSWLARAAQVTDTLKRDMDELDTLITGNEIVIARTKGVGYVAPEVLISHGVTGPILRAAGVDYDIRKVEPYSIYDRFSFNVPVQKEGDAFARFYQRILEAYESIKILEQAFKGIKDTRPGDIMGGKGTYTTKVPAGDAYARIEHSKGELGFYVVSNGTNNPWRYRVRSPSYINLNALGDMCKGSKVADTIVILGAIDIVLGEVDR